MISLPFTPLRRAARRYFGWRSLRPGQVRAMRALLCKRDALVIMPTGGGKSAIYQVPATLLRGPTLVISPLLALQQDQIATLAGRGDDRLAAVRISSAETPNQQRAALQTLTEGRARFLFITPEQLAQPERLAALRALRPALVAVDEAHCISTWGHDFRPDYLRLGHAIRELGRPPVVALTATASPPVREDIVTRLGLRHPRVVVTGLDRPNLHLAAVHCTSEEDRWRRLVSLIGENQSPGIVYAPTRRTAEQLTERLRAAGVDAQAYHGGMAAGLRERRHEDFLADRIAVMVATSAFGMGIDKSNICWIYHVALPDSPDSYLQEIGRAGRDGAPARAVLLWRPQDLALQRFFAGGTPELPELTALAAVLRDGPVSRAGLRERTGLGARRLPQLISLLEEVGAAMTTDKGRIAAPADAPSPAEAARLAVRLVERRQVVQRSRTDMMRHFAESRTCRGQALLAYFGEHLPRSCGHCDNCVSGQASPGESVPAGGVPGDATVSAAATGTEPVGRSRPAQRSRRTGGSAALAVSVRSIMPFPLHSRVCHADWGDGMVMRYESDRMVVLFDEVGYKTLSVPVVQRNGLLRVVDPSGSVHR